MPETDDQFYERADAHIRLSNDQTLEISAGQVSASMLFASARFAAWLTARGHKSGAEMQKQRDENIEYFVKGYRKMLEANMDDYIESFDDYMKPKSGDEIP